MNTGRNAKLHFGTHPVVVVVELVVVLLVELVELVVVVVVTTTSVGLNASITSGVAAISCLSPTAFPVSVAVLINGKYNSISALTSTYR